jgi:uncharacterized protein YndB with AHSA1/START domain
MTDTHATAFDPELDLELRRETDVPPRLVWRAWTEPKLLMQWFTPAPWKTTACELDLRPGGKFHTVMEGPNGEKHDNNGCVLAVVPETFLLFTDALGPGFRPIEGGFMTASVTIEPTATGTLYIARAYHKDVAGKQQHEQMGFHEGWGKAWEQLVALARTL